MEWMPGAAIDCSCARPLSHWHGYDPVGLAGLPLEDQADLEHQAPAPQEDEEDGAGIDCSCARHY